VDNAYFRGDRNDCGKIQLPLSLALGWRNPDGASEPFNMAYLAIRGSGSINGVSRLHGQVSRRLFQPLFPHFSKDKVTVQRVSEMRYGLRHPVSLTSVVRES